MKQSILPKGLYSLVPPRSRKSKRKKESAFYMEIKKIRLTIEQQKKEIDKKLLKELAESIKKYGLIQPIIVSKKERKKKGGGLSVFYYLVSGYKRLMAAKMAGLTVVPAVIREKTVRNDRTKKKK